MKSLISPFLVIHFFVYAFCVLSLFTILFAPPTAYPTGAIVVIPQGTTIGETAELLHEKNALRFPFLFSLAVRLGADTVVAGSYLLPQKQNVLTLAHRFSHGDSGLSSVKVTIPEGMSARQIADVLAEKLPGFDTKDFLTLATPNEGYLFPDTYFFLPGITPQEIVQQMKENFARRTESLQDKIAAFGKTEAEVVTMASILEKEARLPETRRIVAGILWSRLALGMPLQVDATFGYIFGRDTYSPKGADLEVDSPYNTYKYRGLPPGPIGNPGIDALEEAITPIKTPYLYYVTDKEGNIYYAKTLAGHIQNIKKAN